jgi:hypothetical protein
VAVSDDGNSDLFINYNSKAGKRKNYLDKTNHSWGKLAAGIIASPEKINTLFNNRVK